MDQTEDHDGTDRDDALIDRHIAALMEHFDTVQIFVSRHQPGRGGGTMVLDRGAGHWHARYGQIREWQLRMDREVKRMCDHRDDD